MLNLRSAEVTRESLERKKRKALRARSLIENEDFKWWVGELKETLLKHTTHQLVYNDVQDSQRHTYRGIIIGVERALHRLAQLADTLDAIDRELEALDARERKQHTNRKRWGI